jgi:hypothetical protein
MSSVSRGADWTPQRPRGSSTPRRKRVVLADRRRTQRGGRTLVELEEQTSVGEVLVRHLVRAQLRSALLIGGTTALVFAALPLVFWLLPEIGEITVLGIRVPWLVLGVLPYPVLVLVGYLSIRAAERNERDFTHLVER